MSDKEFQRYWLIGAGVAGAIVAVVAALALTLIATARSILANAGRALGLVNEIVTTTQPIWELEQTNAVADQLLEGAQAIRRHATQVADALAGPAAAAAGNTQP
jgi:enoyl-CoA hydratase/carnithine racemase